MNLRKDLMRLFLALPVHPRGELVEILNQLGRMGRNVRPIRPEQLHLTLKFLGDVSTDRIDLLCEAVDEIARETSPFHWSIQGRGAFPDNERPRVVWAGCLPVDPINHLAEVIENRLAAEGFERERQAFHPHITLARVRQRTPEIAEFLNESDTSLLGEESADHVILYRSFFLETSSVSYEPIHESKLAGP